MALVFGRKTALAISGTTATQTGSVVVASDAHDQLLVLIGPVTATVAGTLDIVLWGCDTATGTFWPIYTFDQISAATTIPTVANLTSIYYVLPGFYKVIATLASSGNYTATVEIVPARGVSYGA